MGREPRRRRERGRSEGRRGKVIAALEWHLEWGDQVQFLLDLAEENAAAGLPPPAALLARPELPELAQVAWDAFWDLTAERPLGFGAVGAIPWSTIAAWADRHGIRCGDQFARLKRLVMALDRRWLEHLRASVPKPPNPGAG
ncbi:phage tail assembly chaperone [Methylobacterium nodulans]|uniref:phage tail assembly chaperone n=1 Tax=Methylobacterium nodulans TaxID=114616 RepID=UPI0012EE469C|nr:hypothetical protein [Methylobacterium nodulans]